MSTKPDLPDRYHNISLITTSLQHRCYRGIDRRTGRKVFIKQAIEPCRNIGQHADVCYGIHSEAVVTRYLASWGASMPHVIEVMHYHGRAILVQAYVPGPTLDACLRTQRYHPLAAALILDEVAETVELAHALGYVHHDIKPANIIMSWMGPAFLVDWGAATRIRPPTERLRFISFTPGYASIDQQLGMALVKNDLYALGKTLLHSCRPLTGAVLEVIGRATDRTMGYRDVAAMRRDLQRLADGRRLTFFYR